MTWRAFRFLISGQDPVCEINDLINEKPTLAPKARGRRRRAVARNIQNAQLNVQVKS